MRPTSPISGRTPLPLGRLPSWGAALVLGQHGKHGWASNKGEGDMVVRPAHSTKSQVNPWLPVTVTSRGGELEGL